MTSAAQWMAIVIVALALRVADGQQFQPGAQPAAVPRDPYAPQYQPPPPHAVGQPADLRYPLPQQPAGAYAPPPSQAQPGFNQTLRYPTPPQVGVPASPPLAVPTASPPAGPQPASFSPAVTSPPAQPVLFQRGQIVARVDNKTIFYGDVAPTVNLILDLARNPEERAAIEANRETVTRNFVRLAVRNKMLLCEFERDIPAKIRDNATEFAKKQAEMDKRIRGAFEKTLEKSREQLRTATPEQVQNLMAQEPTAARLALLMKQRQLESLGELDQALRQLGTTLDAQAREFGEAKLGMDALYKHITRSPEVTHQEMLDYYQAHATEYAIEPKASFEILSVKFVNYRDRNEARNAIAAMGNAVYLGGAPFDAIARKHSQEPRASEGGQYDNVTQGSLASKAIDQAIFAMEVGKLSQIVEDESGYHILRVKARQGADSVPFQKAQPEIRTAIQRQKQNAEQQKFLAELSARTTVWTIYDPPANAQVTRESAQIR